MKVTVNGFWNALTDVEKTVKGKENIIASAQLLTLDEMMDHLAEAEIILEY